MDNFNFKEMVNPESNQVEVYFGYSGFTPLFKSNLNKNNLYFFGEDFSIGNIKNIDFDINIDRNKKIRIWSSRTCMQEYLNFLYFCYKFQGRNISVVFVDDYSSNVYSLGATTSDEIPDMLKYEKELTFEELEKYKEDWVRLVNENGELRIFKDKKVMSVDYDYLNEYILKYYNKDMDNITRGVAKLMANDEGNNYSDAIYRFLIERLDDKIK